MHRLGRGQLTICHPGRFSVHHKAALFEAKNWTCCFQCWTPFPEKHPHKKTFSWICLRDLPLRDTPEPQSWCSPQQMGTSVGVFSIDIRWRLKIKKISVSGVYIVVLIRLQFPTSKQGKRGFDGVFRENNRSSYFPMHTTTSRIYVSSVVFFRHLGMFLRSICCMIFCLRLYALDFFHHFMHLLRSQAWIGMLCKMNW